jgi:hypothetical protein
MLATIRGAHYFGLQPQHRAVRSVSKAGVKGWWMGWWAMLWLWPLPVYCLPLLIRFVNGMEPTHPGEDDDGSRMHMNGLMGVTGVTGLTAAGGVVAGAASVLPNLLDGAEEGQAGVGGLQDSGVSVTLLLALLAGHAVVLTLSESLFAHMVTKTPLFGGMDAPTGTWPERQDEDEI